ncbi:hypothetical protein PR048_030598 [Dryococelus australis]|uniref:Uncharacterized protein n=1 Tax=Dryococelus australis TaxID=614101 RepID=A0ABQ9G9E5_9NEOP|nr:hypothetical protein PR048_030598 [Dryococelus australis]
MEQRRNERAGGNEKTRLPAASSGTIPTVQNPASRLSAQSPRPLVPFLTGRKAPAGARGNRSRGCRWSTGFLRYSSTSCKAYLSLENYTKRTAHRIHAYTDYTATLRKTHRQVTSSSMIPTFRRPPTSGLGNARLAVQDDLGGLRVSRSLLASYQGEPGSIPGRVTEFYQVGIVPGDAIGRRVFSGISRFSLPFIPAPLHTHPNHPHWLSRPRSCQSHLPLATSLVARSSSIWRSILRVGKLVVARASLVRRGVACLVTISTLGGNQRRNALYFLPGEEWWTFTHSTSHAVEWDTPVLRAMESVLNTWLPLQRIVLDTRQCQIPDFYLVGNMTDVASGIGGLLGMVMFLQPLHHLLLTWFPLLYKDNLAVTSSLEISSVQQSSVCVFVRRVESDSQQSVVLQTFCTAEVQCDNLKSSSSRSGAVSLQLGHWKGLKQEDTKLVPPIFGVRDKSWRYPLCWSGGYQLALSLVAVLWLLSNIAQGTVSLVRRVHTYAKTPHTPQSALHTPQSAPHAPQNPHDPQTAPYPTAAPQTAPRPKAPQTHKHTQSHNSTTHTSQVASSLQGLPPLVLPSEGEPPKDLDASQLSAMSECCCTWKDGTCVDTQGSGPSVRLSKVKVRETFYYDAAWPICGTGTMPALRGLRGRRDSEEAGRGLLLFLPTFRTGSPLAQGAVAMTDFEDQRRGPWRGPLPRASILEGRSPRGDQGGLLRATSKACTKNVDRSEQLRSPQATNPAAQFHPNGPDCWAGFGRTPAGVEENISNKLPLTSLALFIHLTLPKPLPATDRLHRCLPFGRAQQNTQLTPRAHSRCLHKARQLATFCTTCRKEHVVTRAPLATTTGTTYTISKSFNSPAQLDGKEITMQILIYDSTANTNAIHVPTEVWVSTRPGRENAASPTRLIRRVDGAAVAERLDCSPHTTVNRVEPLAESHRLFASENNASGGFSRESLVSLTLAFRCCSILTSFYPRRLSRPLCDEHTWIARIHPAILGLELEKYLQLQSGGAHEAPMYLELLCVFKVQKRRSDTGDTNSRPWGHVAPTRKASNWLALFPRALTAARRASAVESQTFGSQKHVAPEKCATRSRFGTAAPALRTMISLGLRWRSGQALASHHGDPGSIPGGFTPGSSRVTLVLNAFRTPGIRAVGVPVIDMVLFLICSSRTTHFRTSSCHVTGKRGKSPYSLHP